MMEISHLHAADDIAVSVKNSIKSYTRSKNTAIFIYKELIKFIKDAYGVEINLEMPEWVPTTTLERQIQIVKLLHDPSIKISELEDMLVTSKKTIDTDLKKLKGDDEDPIEVMGQKLVVTFERSKDHLYFDSTIHPLFLTFNLTQVITTLEGLNKMAEDSAHKKYAMFAAKTIWSQLSQYAKRRIFTVSDGLGLDTTWYNSLECVDRNLFYSETMCSGISGSESILYCFKNGKPCYIEYLQSEDHIVYYENCLILRYQDNQVSVEINGETLILDANRVRKAALTRNGLY